LHLSGENFSLYTLELHTSFVYGWMYGQVSGSSRFLELFGQSEMDSVKLSWEISGSRQEKQDAITYTLNIYGSAPQ
jgi:hypothetical protein